MKKERFSTPSNSGGFGFAIPLSPLLGFPGASAGKESTCNVGDLGSIPGLGKSLGEGNGYPVQYSGLENSMDYTVHGVAKSWTQLSNFRTHTFPTLTTIKKIAIIHLFVNTFGKYLLAALYGSGPELVLRTQQ